MRVLKELLEQNRTWAEKVDLNVCATNLDDLSHTHRLMQWAFGQVHGPQGPIHLDMARGVT